MKIPRQRKVFHIDVGDMSPEDAKKLIESQDVKKLLEELLKNFKREQLTKHA